MKFAVLIGDGMADRPLEPLGGKTPLMAAHTPNMDRLAQKGTVGAVRTIPKGFPPGSDVANLSIMGYDPHKYYTGRAPLEAASMGVELTRGDVAYRCNLVTLAPGRGGGGGDYTESRMLDYSSGHVTSEEAGELIAALQAALGNEEIKFHPGVSYRHLMLWRDGEHEAACTPPHDITGEVIAPHLPTGPGQKRLVELMERSADVLKDHPVNRARTGGGKRPANSIWLWGQGGKPSLPDFKEKFGLTGGAIVSAVDLTRGLGICAGLEVLKVPGITGYVDTNYSGKAEHSLRALKEWADFVYIHVEAPDEAAHEGNVDLKIKAIEDFDSLVVGPVMDGMKALGAHRVLLLPDHATPIEIKTHSEEPVPFVLYDSTVEADSAASGFSEELAHAPHAIHMDEGHRLMEYLIRGRVE